MAVYVTIAFLAVIVLVPIFLYNALVSLRVRVKNAWAQIDVQLKRRHDLIPNLVEVVKGYAAHEKETLENVTRARGQAMGASGMQARGTAENMLTGALRSLFAVVENYPNLKADRSFLGLQEELITTENRIAFARQYYNDEVMRLNTAVQSVPYNIIAGMFTFKTGEFLRIENTAHKEPPPVKIQRS